MEKLLAYVENKAFVKWVYHPDESSDFYWTSYLTNHPEEKRLIEEARTIVLRLKSKPEPETIPAERLLQRIITETSRRARRQKTIRMVGFTLQLAAVAILFFAAGIYVMNLRYRHSVSEMSLQFANVSVFNGHDARLILTDGKSITITEKQSTIKYLSNGSVVVGNNDTINQKVTTTAAPVNQLIVPFGKSSSIVLPDGTTAFLNAGSRLIFPPVFAGSTREVFLAGEGYFLVAHHPEKPFFVKTTDLDVRAIGTQFNVSAYPAEKKIEVVLTEGKVNIIPCTPSLFQHSEEMVPNDMICYNKETAKIGRKQVQPEYYVSWHQGYINFESSELQKLTTKLERYYDVTIHFGNPETAQKKITGKLQLKANIDEILRILASTTTLEIEKINEHEYLLN